MTSRYRFDPSQSRVTVQAFVAGLLAFVGHSPTFWVRDFDGALRREGTGVQNMAVEFTAQTSSLELLDKLSDADHREIEKRLRQEVLATDVTPTVVFQSEHIAAQAIGSGRYRLDIGGRLSLHGVTQPYRVAAELSLADDRIRLRGTDQLAMSDFRIKPVTALGGTITLKDEVLVTFDLVGIAEAS